MKELTEVPQTHSSASTPTSCISLCISLCTPTHARINTKTSHTKYPGLSNSARFAGLDKGRKWLQFGELVRHHLPMTNTCLVSTGNHCLPWTCFTCQESLLQRHSSEFGPLGVKREPFAFPTVWDKRPLSWVPIALLSYYHPTSRQCGTYYYGELLNNLG
ncbi:hypothetical protein GGI43DRAFT_249172 [Trichoderma evansii]